MRQFTSIFVYLLFPVFLQSTWAKKQDTLTFVLDLDSTLIETIGYRPISKKTYDAYKTHKKVTYDLLKKAEFKFLDFHKTPHINDPKFLEKIIEVKEEIKGQHYLTYYRVVDWAPEFLDFLTNLPIKSKLYVFSGSSENRNIQALEKIELSDGPLSEKIKGVFSSHHLFPVATKDQPAHPRFADRFKKDISLANSDISNVILIDDYHNFVPKHQIKNQLILFGVNWHFEHYSDKALFFKKHLTKRVPHNKAAHFVGRNKLAFAQAIIQHAVNIYIQENGRESFSDIIYRLTRYSSESIELLPAKQIRRRTEYQYVLNGLKYFKSNSPSCRSIF